MIVLALFSTALSLPLIAQAQTLASGDIVFPIMSPKLSSKFGPRNHPLYKSVRHHSGIDLAVPPGSHVRAVRAGKVVFADSYSNFGKLVTIEHDDGFVSLYGHLDEILVNPGMQINAGALIGRVGSTGGSTGPHLHFEWRKAGAAVDPLKVFPGLLEVPQG